MDFEDRPWGRFDVLADTPTHKVKRLTVKPGQRLSYQRHKFREELWTMVSGEADVTLDGSVHHFRPGQIARIPRGTKHRVANPSSHEDLVFIEVQLGSYFGEDDIERFEDDYHRATQEAS